MADKSTIPHPKAPQATVRKARSSNATWCGAPILKGTAEKTSLPQTIKTRNVTRTTFSCPCSGPL
jgi:hypothetical protein